MDGSPDVVGDRVYHSRDRVFGDLDWNDNTPILQPLQTSDNVTGSYMANNSTNTNLSPTKLISAGASPSPISSMPGLLYSPEDTLNNDFFYDDEFTVPFDANLSDRRLTGSLLDAEDINDFLSLSKDYGGGGGAEGEDDNNEWHMPKMVVSKSDSCLYQADGEFSGSEQNMSQELSNSEKDCASSSELSDFRAEPLFSPQPSASIQDGETSTNKIELSVSESCDNQYNYDWRANKDQYMISFDKQCGKQYSSDESSFHESVHGQWQHKSYTSQVSWGSLASKNHSLGMAGDEGDEDEDGEPRYCSLSQPDAQEMTTWQRLKQQASHVTWAALKKAHKEVRKEAAAANVRSKSVPDFSEQVLGRAVATVECVDGAGEEEGEDCIDGGVHGDSDSQEHSTKTLLELFHRMRSHSSGESLGMGLDCNEAMISPTSLHRLTGTWSMSTISSTQSHSHQNPDPIALSPTPQSAPPALVSWNTFQNLHSDRLVKVSMVDSITSDRNTTSRTRTSHLDSVSQFDMANFAAQVGSGILTESRMYGSSKKKVESGTQYSFYANVRDCGIQTSWNMNDGVVKKSRITVALQTSFDKKQRPQMNEMATSVILLKTAHERLSSSVIGVPLPDLSFLGKVTCTPRNGTKRSHKVSEMLDKKSAQSQTDTKEPNASVKSSPKSVRRRDKHRAQRQQSTSLESSSSGGYPSRSRNSIHMIANASFCSSSSSGIDPGSSTCDSQNHLHITDLSDSNPDIGAYKTNAGKSPQPRVPVQKVVGTVCSECNGKSQKTMTVSHPVVRQKKESDLKSLEYLQVSPTHPKKPPVGTKVAQKRPRSMIPVVNKPKSRLPIPEKKQQQLFTCSRSQSQPDSLDDEAKLKPPLKSCLVKRTNKRDRRSIMMKHRSWSDPRDALVMKHSAEGQVRYQLIAAKQACDKKDEKSKIPTKGRAAVKPQKEEHTNIAIQLSETLSKAKLATTDAKSKKVPPPPPPKPPRHLIKDPRQAVQVPSPVTEQPMAEQPGAEQPGSDQEQGQAMAAQQTPDQSRASQPRAFATKTEVRAEVAEVHEVASPEQQIPLPSCGCLLQSSSESAGSGDSMSRAKKSVSFSERVSYHSPYTSPSQSPKKAHTHRVSGGTQTAEKKATEAASSAPIPVPGAERSRSRGVELPPLLINTEAAVTGTEESVCSSASSNEAPPCDFLVSPSHSPPISAHTAVLDCLVLAQKKELVVRVVHGAEVIIRHFQEAKDSKEKVIGGCEEEAVVEGLVVEHLIPALYALLMDGLNPFTSSFFGRLKNNVWSIVELTGKQGSGTMMMCGFVKDMKKLRFLNTPWLKFNAFIFCLLNHSALELWVLSLYGHRAELFRQYAVTSFLHVALGSGAGPGRDLWHELATALQPLAQLPFKLRYATVARLLAGDSEGPRGADTRTSRGSSQASSQASSQVAEEVSACPYKASRSMDNVRVESDVDLSTPVKGVRHSFSEQILLKTSEKTKDFVKGKTGKTAAFLREKAVVAKTQQYLVSASSVLLKNVLQAPRQDAIAWREKDPSKPKLQRLFSREKSKSLDVDSYSERKAANEGSNCNSASVDTPEHHHSATESVSSSTECAPTLYSLSSVRSDCSQSSSLSSDQPIPPQTTKATKKSGFRRTLGSFGPTLIKLFDNVLLDSTRGKENAGRSGRSPKPNTPSQIPMSRSVPTKLSARTGEEEEEEEEEERRGTAQIILDGDNGGGEVRRRPGAADLRKRRGDKVGKEQQERSVTALCSYSSMDSAELSFEKGSTLTVLEDVDSEWLRCRLADSHGLVHRACVH